MILAALALALALEPAPPARAAPAAEHHMGWHSCEDWTRARQVSRERPMEEWAWGYLTAFTRYGPRTDAAARAEMRRVIWSRLDAYCAADQRATFGDAVSMLVDELRRRRPPRRR
jgi:hypothetical protein